MNKENVLKQLNIFQLNALIGHLQFGLDHLRRYLTDKQLMDLLDYAIIKPERKENIKADALERYGYILLMVNTVFTCIIGGWLATFGLLGISAASTKYLLIFVIFAASILGGVFGYFSFKKVKSESYTAINMQKLLNLQAELLRIIKEKKLRAVKTTISDLNNKSNVLNKGDHFQTIRALEDPHDFKQEFIKWLNILLDKINIETHYLRKNKIFKLTIERLMLLQSRMRRVADKVIGLKSETNSFDLSVNDGRIQEKSQLNSKKKEEKSFIAVLTNLAVVLPKEKVKKEHWLKGNLYSLLNGLAPTVFGSFCSLFTYFQGLPDLAVELGLVKFNRILGSYTAKSIVLILIMLITIYFVYLFVYINRKSCERQKERDAIEKLIANMENELVELNTKLNMLRKVKRYFDEIVNILSFTAEVSIYFKQLNFEINKPK